MGRPKGSKSKRPSPLKGRTYEDIYGEELAKYKRLQCAETHKVPYPKGSKMPDHIRENMKLSGKIGGIRKGAGRGKKGRYKNIWCDSSWELAFVIWHLDNGYSVERNLIFYLYTWEKKEHKYYPDFIINGELFEVKGFYSDKDKEKIKQCPVKIKVLLKEDILPFIEYVKRTYKLNKIEDLYDGVN